MRFRRPSDKPRCDRAPVSGPPFPEVAAPLSLDLARIAVSAASARAKSRIPRSLAASVLLHSLPLLALIGWRAAPQDIPKPIPVELVIEQPPPPQQKPAAAEKPPPPPPSARRASADMAEATAPKPEPGVDRAPPNPAEPEPRPEPPTPTATPPEPAKPAAAEPLPEAPAAEQKTETKVAALTPPPPPRPTPHKQQPTVAMTSSWPLPLRQDLAPHAPQHFASLTGPSAIRDEYCVRALHLTLAHLDLLPHSFLGDRRGRAVLSIRILGDGTINSVRVAQSSGYPDIDQRIEKMVFAVGQYPPLPPRMPGAWMDFSFIMVFPDPYGR